MVFNYSSKQCQDEYGFRQSCTTHHSFLTRQRGFTLIEALVVIAIIAILALIAIPSQINKHNQIKIAETIDLAEAFKQNIQQVYLATGVFPPSNIEAGMPEPDKIIGNFLKRLEVVDGAMHLVLGKKFSRFEDQVVTIYPIYVEGSSGSPISWVCGYGAAPEGMKSAGENRTTVSKPNLPIRCR